MSSLNTILSEREWTNRSAQVPSRHAKIFNTHPSPMSKKFCTFILNSIQLEKKGGKEINVLARHRFQSDDVITMNQIFRNVFKILILVLWSLSLHAEDLPKPQEQKTFDLESMQSFDGSIIHEIQIHGIKYTKERAIRWLLSQHEGDRFSGEIWLKGIHKLYDTTVLYDINTSIHRVDNGQIDIDLSVEDRWTLLPFGIAQAGGGSNNVGGGIWEANVLGYFAQMGGSYSVFNGVASFDYNIYQEFFRDTNYMWGIDISIVGDPVDLQNNAGSSIGSYTWSRQQEQILIGRKFESKYASKIRLFGFLETFKDSMVDNSKALDVGVYQSDQYRIRPTLIIGRSELTNFLEEGYEFTLAPTSANFFSENLRYSQFVTTYKKVILDKNTNYAFFINGGVMSKAPIPYVFRLGGYDTVRGFSTNRAVGRYYVVNSSEYRPYLFRFSLPWLGQTIVQGAAFEDAAVMWNSNDLTQTGRMDSTLGLFSAGVGLRLNIIRFAGSIVRIDAAQTISPQEGWGASLGVGQFF